jgi:hypothetical protein
MDTPETPSAHPEVDAMLRRYKAAVDAWIEAIREEVALASRHDSIEEVDQWEAAHGREEEARDIARQAKQEYEEAIRREYYGF